MFPPRPWAPFAAAVVVTAGACLARAVQAQTTPPTSEVPGILVSRQLAESRALEVGSTVQLASTPGGEDRRTYRIDGIYEPTPDPMRFAQQRLEVRLHLPDLIALAPREGERAADPAVTSINVGLAAGADAAAFARDVESRLPGVMARPTSDPDDRSSTFVVIERFHFAIAIVTVLGSAVFLLALMVMLVEERRATVGILRLLGFTRGRILAQVFAEGAVIALAGAGFGVLFAIASQGAFNSFFQWRYDTALVFLRVTPAVVAQALLIAVPLGMAASVLASWTLLRQQLLALIRR